MRRTSALLLALLLPGLLLVGAAACEFRSAIAVERAFPVPDYLAIDVALPTDAYRAAYAALGDADPRDGVLAVWRAEAAARGGMANAEIVRQTQAALRLAPASARGWTLLAESLAGSDPKGTERALGVALDLSPADFWLTPRQLVVAARLWPTLSADTRAAAVRRARLLWIEPSLRPAIPGLLAETKGPDLMMTALGTEELRALNRWVAAEERKKMETMK